MMELTNLTVLAWQPDGLKSLSVTKTTVTTRLLKSSPTMGHDFALNNDTPEVLNWPTVERTGTVTLKLDSFTTLQSASNRHTSISKGSD